MVGGKINGVFHTVEQAKMVLSNLLDFKKHFLNRYSHKKKLPQTAKRYIKVIDLKINDANKIIKKYG